MHRLFVGLPVPEPVADVLVDLMEDVPDARWQSVEQLHLTLCFIGEVDRRLGNAVAEGLADVRGGALDLRLGPLGLFAHRGRVHTLFAGVGPKAGLALLSAKVTQAVRAAQAMPEARAFVPHVTIARFGGRGPAEAAMAPVLARAVPAVAWRADELVLYESFMGSGGSHYEAVARWPLH
ncbi:RNA 2',3'-cyclic phosphodiesterase [Sandaracinobacteroides saxicola]|uniref:RNA 2',3'-cyclic phosphodiesterase n=1 Tax=Sandaracinobacteroides saxicola TaxID=2759707 RepID=A0A7G5IET1_9SPHN|nr:RNA 2',3'-cyclic phosphodiesterase [Sandaracinobacteroides saxicola]QMW21873.1 RNA 2',3'-cyclic phosphodiesterase [Sandaracinobacteroides saxicola]